LQLKASLRGHDYATQVQMLAPDGAGLGRAPSVHEAAALGTSGAGAKLPDADKIQQSFGGYDISNVQAHTDNAATQGSRAMGADAYATGNHVVLGEGGRDLHTQAHEAGCVVQQQQGVSLSGGVGEAGDAYEQQADAVADRVVQGKSAEDLFGQMGGGGGLSGVQMQEQEESHETSPATVIPHPNSDPVVAIARRIAEEHPDGVPVAIYNPVNRELVRQGEAWAASEMAIAATAGSSPEGLRLGYANAGGETIPQILQRITSALTGAAASMASQSLEATKPLVPKIRSLALFAHGQPRWLGLKANGRRGRPGDIDDSPDGTPPADFISQISSQLTGDVRLALFACETGRNEEERPGWVEGSTESGGQKSLGGELRDSLALNGHDGASVATHPTFGHTTRNFVVREFSVEDGRGAEGRAFFEEYVWDWLTNGTPAIFDAMVLTGFDFVDPKPRATAATWLDKEIQKEVYRVYSAAMTSHKLEGRNLAEMAMTRPVDVGNIIKPIWLARWSKVKTELTESVMRRYARFLRPIRFQPADPSLEVAADPESD